MKGNLLWEAARYAGIVFLVGCVLGTVREMVVAPALGRTTALAMETPLMIGVSALFAFRLRGHWSRDLAWRLRLGGTALIVLLALEEALTRLLLDGSIFAFWARLPWVDLTLTVTGLVVFAIIPLAFRRRQAIYEGKRPKPAHSGSDPGRGPSSGRTSR